MNLAELGSAFRHARLARNLTQSAVARAAGVHATTVSDFERGALTELGAVKVIALLESVGLELLARPHGHARTLDDIARAQETALPVPERKRARAAARGATGRPVPPAPDGRRLRDERGGRG